ncbi:MAG: hypothetical protein ACLUEQ_02800 [Cloacibacillus evryensis]
MTVGRGRTNEKKLHHDIIEPVDLAAEDGDLLLASAASSPPSSPRAS